MSRELTERQRRFVEAYVGEAQGNSTRAAELAGYPHPGVQGAQTLGNIRVRQAIEAARVATTSSAIATREERQTFLTAMMRGDEPGEPKDRLKACELLGKMQGDFVEKHEVKHEGQAVVIQLPGDR